MAKPQVLDPCCGSKMFWFDNENPDVLFGDIRDESHILCDGRKLEIKPDQLLDFRNLPFDDSSFKLVVFDPPHFVRAGEKGWQKKKYGKLNKTWQDDLKLGFSECFRVLATSGILIFKWNETQIKTSEILKLTDEKPLFGHVSGKRANTHWICFMKQEMAINNEDAA
ncbi:MAG: SAM-dependent methyltransferase [Bacteroidetes bacterium]|nr:SAM-dependent methyltransferase [Bacteroidota bacterium]